MYADMRRKFTAALWHTRAAEWLDSRLGHDQEIFDRAVMPLLAEAAATVRAAARQTTGQDDTEPALAVGQPAEAHDTEARMRQLILNCLTGRAVCPVPRPVDEATGLLDAYRAAVLRTAANPVEGER